MNSLDLPVTPKNYIGIKIRADSRTKPTKPTFRAEEESVPQDREKRLQALSERTSKDLASVTEKPSQLISELTLRRRPLIQRRNEILDSVFFFFRPSLKLRLAEIDRELDDIDFALQQVSRGEGPIEADLLEEMRNTQARFTASLNRLEKL